jgi:RimJ/RimL family protein N-acetyltransferase
MPVTSLRHTVPTLTTIPAVPAVETAATAVTRTDWQTGLPTLRIAAATLRELRPSDAAALLDALAAQQVTRFISPPPTTVEGFERFIAWTAAEQAAGRYLCYAVVPDGCDRPVGIIQVRQLDPGFGVAEWGFALSPSCWGTGLFHAAATAVIDFVFGFVGVHRLEARAAVVNGRGNGALLKLGATRDGLLRRSFLKDGEYLDQILWGLTAAEWQATGTWSPERIH